LLPKAVFRNGPVAGTSLQQRTQGSPGPRRAGLDWQAHRGGGGTGFD